MKKADRITRSIKNCRGSRLFKGCSPLQLLCNLTGKRPQSATFHAATVMVHNEKRKIIENLENCNFKVTFAYS